MVDWKAMLPEVQEATQKEFRDAGEHYAVSISRTAEVTGRGTLEALVDLGSGGAYTDAMTVMRMEDGRPVVALFRGKDGMVSSMVFLEGASVMHGKAVEMVRSEHAIFSGHWSRNSDGTKFGKCKGEAYRWNAAAKRFDFSQGLSNKLTRDFCRKKRAEVTTH
ncbi:hypothetical protein [Edaphobacter bradus]|uniref:hypothetical protein n=1 Tax=Edaphobacter bradus TaxID=2259016 RepID=UPI0021E0751E|nr:hypothetical protein [Edaphobacter bradus]